LCGENINYFIDESGKTSLLQKKKVVYKVNLWNEVNQAELLPIKFLNYFVLLLIKYLL